jgi:hypothetical protein
MLVPDELRTNAYRTLGLSVNATSSEVHASAGRAKRAIALGSPQKFPTNYPALGPTPEAEDDIRSALGRLSNPSQRLHDRLFWFHKQSALNALHSAIASDPILQPFTGHAELHDIALDGLLKAFEANVDDNGLDTWVRALSEWHAVIADDAYWGLCWALEERGEFEPKALTSELEVLRAEALRLSADGLMSVGRNAAVHGYGTTLAGVLSVLERLDNTGSWAQTARVELSSLALERVRELCRKVREDAGSRIGRTNDAAAANKIACDAALSRYRNEVQPALQRAAQFLPMGKEKENANALREAAALCLWGIAVDYTWANDFIRSQELYEEALKLATGTVAAIKIESGLAEILDSARRQRIFAPLKTISAAPSLRTINGFGFHLYGNTDYHKETNSYATTYYFVGLFVPLIPLARYRVRDTGPSQYSFLGKLPLRKGDRLHQAIFVGAILWMTFFNSNGNSSSSHQAQQPILNFDSLYSAAQADSATRQAAAGSGPFDDILTPSNTNAPPAELGNATSERSELTRLKSEIDGNRSRITMLDLQIRPASDDLDRLESQIQMLKNEIESLRADQDSQLPINIDSFNSKVDEYNSLVMRQRSQLASYRSNVDLYNMLVERDKSLVAQYNALLR